METCSDTNCFLKALSFACPRLQPPQIGKTHAGTKNSVVSGILGRQGDHTTEARSFVCQQWYIAAGSAAVHATSPSRSRGGWKPDASPPKSYAEMDPSQLNQSSPITRIYLYRIFSVANLKGVTKLLPPKNWKQPSPPPELAGAPVEPARASAIPDERPWRRTNSNSRDFMHRPWIQSTTNNNSTLKFIVCLNNNRFLLPAKPNGSNYYQQHKLCIQHFFADI